jgi:hypothetical protein
LEAYGRLGRSQTEFSESFHQRGIVRMQRATVYEPVKGFSVWSANNDFEQMAKHIHDQRPGHTRLTKRSMAPSDILLCERDTPAFGEFKDLWQRFERYLANEGFGRFT